MPADRDSVQLFALAYNITQIAKIEPRIERLCYRVGDADFVSLMHDVDSVISSKLVITYIRQAPGCHTQILLNFQTGQWLTIMLSARLPDPVTGELLPDHLVVRNERSGPDCKLRYDDPYFIALAARLEGLLRSPALERIDRDAFPKGFRF